MTKVSAVVAQSWCCFVAERAQLVSTQNCRDEAEHSPSLGSAAWHFDSQLYSLVFRYQETMSNDCVVYRCDLTRARQILQICRARHRVRLVLAETCCSLLRR